ncbi:hypothetical protein CL614_06690 [archaeon]|nr:hypothetical protein [archaeon]|tara:strand:- start:4265 stop:4600 length:336 start_codon:yes stop_codon:yes gene_type:complete
MIEFSSFIILILANIVTAVILLFSIRYNFKFGVMILRVQDSIEESLDLLDQRYAAMSKIAETPVFFDSVEVRQVISEIEASRDSILSVANSLISSAESDKTIDTSGSDIQK